MKYLKHIVVCLMTACGLTLGAAAQDVINTVVGGGPNGIPAVNSNVNQPYEVAVDAAGNVYFAASQQERVFKISPAGILSVVAGTGAYGYSGDGGPATKAQLYTPWGVAVDNATPLPNVYIGDYNNCLVRKVNQNTGIITTIAGFVNHPASGNPYPSCGYQGNGGPANEAYINGPAGVRVNPKTDDVYFADYDNGVVRMIKGGTPTGTISLVAGSGGSTTSGENCQGTAPYGDGGKATSANLCYPQDVALDTSVTPANVFISDGNQCAIREVVGSSGDIYDVAGNYTCGFTDNVTATSGQLNDPWQLNVSVSGSTTTVDVADYSNARIRQFTLTYAASVPKPGTITTIGGKGQGGFCGDAGPVLDACMDPVGLAYDSSGNYYIGDYGTDRISKVTKSTTDVNTIAGWGPDGGTNASYSNPIGLSGSGGTPSLYYPSAVYADPNSSDVYIGGYYGQAVYLWNSSTNEIGDFAGNGVAGFDGDGGTATNPATELNYPQGIGKDSKGNVYIADTNNCAIREVATNGDITTIAGGSPGDLRGCGFSGDGEVAINAQFSGPNSVVVDASGNIYIADYNNCAIRKIAAGSNIVSTIAGEPTVGCGYSGDGGPAVDAKIYHPQGISIDGAGNLYFADQANNRVREIVAQSKIIQTVAGYYYGGYTGDGAATSNAINQPGFTAADTNGNVFFSDTNNQILRWVTPSGTMITFAGIVPGSSISSAGYSGDGGPALSAQMYYPEGVSRDSNGNTYVADYYNYRIRQITPFAGYGLSTVNLSFETQPAGTMSDFQPITVSAVGPTTISNVTVGSGFSEVDDCVGEPLIAGQTCEIDVYFQPSSAGKTTGTLTISSNAMFALNPNTVSLAGTGSGLTLTGSLAFGTEPLKTPLPETVTLKNSGSTSTLRKIYLTGTTDFSITGGTCPLSGGVLASGASCTIIVSFSPQTVGGKKSTLVVISSDPASPLLTQATGNGTEVKTSASSIAFGSIYFGTSATSNLTVTNTGTASFTLSPSIIGAGFLISSTGKTCTTSLVSGASCVLPIEYDPSAIGNNSGTLTLTTNGGSSPVIPLSGTALTDASVSPTSVAFGTITHGTTKTVNVTVSNVGTLASMTVSTAISGTGAADFTVLSTGNTCGTAVAAKKSCILPVEFKPAVVGSDTATLTVTTNGGSNPIVALTGTAD